MSLPRPPTPAPAPAPVPPRRNRTWLWIALTAVAALLVADGGGIALYMMGRKAVDRAVKPSRSRPQSGPNNGGPLAAPSHAAPPIGVPCVYLPADRGQGEPRLVETPAPIATLTGRVKANIKTNLGVISVDLFADRAPCTVHSFVHLAKQDYYTDTDCHRLTTDGLWVLQCGDPSGTGSGSPGYQFGEENLPTSATPHYPRGTVAMANAGPGTNGGQFFMVYRDSEIPPDYSVFGTVTTGMDLIERAAAGGTDDGSTDGRPKLAVHLDEVTVA